MNDHDRSARQKQICAALWERANEALLRVQDERVHREMAQQLHRQGQNRVVADADTDGSPDSFVIRIEVWMVDRWCTIARIRPADLGLTAEEVAEEVQLVRWQSGVDIPDDISGLENPPST